MDRACDVCGITYTAKRASSRYCSPRCKTRAHRASDAVKAQPTSKAQPRPEAPVVPIPTPEPAEALAVSVAESTRRALVELGRLESPLGQATMVLARRLDNPGSDTGAGLASLAKQYQATFAVATEGAKVEEDPLDELRARRDRKKQAL